MKSQKKILFIISELGSGGAQRSISLLSYYLSQSQDVALCVISANNEPICYKTCKNIVYISPPKGKGLLAKIKAWKYRIRRLKQIKSDFNPDVSISFLEGSDYANIITKGNEKVILSIRGSKQFDHEIIGFKGFLRKKILIPYFYKKADLITCVSKDLATEMNTYFHIPQSKLKVIYNFYETNELIKLSKDELSEDENKIFQNPTIINSGRLHSQKQQDKLIELFAKINTNIKCSLIILGEGELKENLMSQAEGLGLSYCDWVKTGFKIADVYFLGYKSNPFKYYKKCTIFSLTSSYEGFPNVLAEALICGLPVISTDCPTGPREILAPKLKSTPKSYPYECLAGVLMPLIKKENDISLWADTIEQLIKNNSKLNLYSQNGTKQMLCFDVDNIIEDWLDAIE